MGAYNDNNMKFEREDKMKCLITLRSQTHALKAQKILYENRVPSSLIKLDNEYAKKGCSYGITFDCRNRAVVKKLLQDYSLPYSDIRTL